MKLSGPIPGRTRFKDSRTASASAPALACVFEEEACPGGITWVKGTAYCGNDFESAIYFHG